MPLHTGERRLSPSAARQNAGAALSVTVSVANGWMHSPAFKSRSSCDGGCLIKRRAGRHRHAELQGVECVTAGESQPPDAIARLGCSGSAHSNEVKTAGVANAHKACKRLTRCIIPFSGRIVKRAERRAAKRAFQAFFGVRRPRGLTLPRRTFIMCTDF